MANPGDAAGGREDRHLHAVRRRPVPQDRAPAGRAHRAGQRHRRLGQALAENPDPATAAIAPALAAELYGLEILARDIEDEAHNTTRFIVLTADANPPRPPPGVACVTSFTFRVRNLPAALYKALGGFATNGVNMTKLESYMENGAFTATF